MRTTLASLFVLFGNGCIAPDSSSRIDVSEPNDLGVQTVTTERSMVDGNRVFTLRALDASDEQVGMVRLTTGSIPELTTRLPGSSDRGSEIAITIGENTSRILTRETHAFRFTPGLMGGAEPQLVALASVSSALAREANIEVVLPVSKPDVAYSTQTCPASYLNTTPVAQQCCFEYDDAPDWTVFSRSADNAIIERQKNPVNDGSGWPGSSACRASDGVSPCDGNACYFGPNGFARASVYLPYQPYPIVFKEINAVTGVAFCGLGFALEPLPKPSFRDVTGTFPTGAGCPTGSGSSGEYEWDY